jgi:chemotaxis protein methyltransferase CheR
VNGRDCQELLGWAAGPLGLRARGFRRVRGQVAKRVGKRLAALGLADAQAYRAYLASHPAEWEVLDSLCRVTISRFFRDGPVWRFLVEQALPRLAQGSVRAWSAGCASGEEAYSLALAARLARVPVEVLGTDADGALLARAERGVYPAGTLRELPGLLAREAFEPVGEDEVRLREAFRAGVRFEQQDVRRAWPGGPFQLVLCRNVVCTYFAPELQRRVLSELAARLSPGGVLVLGKGEALPEDLPGFVLEPCGGWPVYRREAPAA